jgi:hypothetical protein
MPVEPIEPTPLTHRCAWTNHPVNDRDCDRSIPHAAVAAARQSYSTSTLDLPTREDYFECRYDGELWLAWDRGNGEIGHVLCPTHRAQR